LQGVCVNEPRTVTPEVAGSSPVAPVRSGPHRVAFAGLSRRSGLGRFRRAQQRSAGLANKKVTKGDGRAALTRSDKGVVRTLSGGAQDAPQSARCAPRSTSTARSWVQRQERQAIRSLAQEGHEQEPSGLRSPTPKAPRAAAGRSREARAHRPRAVQRRAGRRSRGRPPAARAAGCIQVLTKSGRRFRRSRPGWVAAGP
jgi:hypothetical protein